MAILSNHLSHHKWTLVFLILCALYLSSIGTATAKIRAIRSVSSPGGLTELTVGKDETGQLFYAVSNDHKEIICWSKLGLVVDGKDLGAHTSNIKFLTSSFAGKFPWHLGQNDEIDNNYTQLVVRSVSFSEPFTVVFRVFPGSIAFRYELSDNKGTGARYVSGETTQFHFNDKYLLYQYNEESKYNPVDIDDLKGTCDFPATLTGAQQAVCIGEADNHNYTKGELIKTGPSNNLSITYTIDSLHAYRKSAIKTDKVIFKGGLQTPWRTLSFAGSSLGLLHFSELNLKLLSPSEETSFKNIIPGKLIRAQLNTQSGLDCINFAAKHHFQYVMFDAGWYGAEFRTSSDPTKVIPEIDMAKVIDYGKKYDIGIILYVNYVGLRQKIDTILPLYKKWGVKGLKFGFVDGLSQKRDLLA